MKCKLEVWYDDLNIFLMLNIISEEECICIPTFLHKGYGNCKTDYQGKGPICYVSKEAAKYCSDAKKSESASRRTMTWKGYSWEACKTYKPYKG